MTDWIEHNGGPQPVGDDVWVEAQWPFEEGHFSGNPDEMEQASELPWEGCKLRYRILNQHLIDAKQAEIDRLKDELETWQSVFPHVIPDRLKSGQQLAEEDVAAKINAARLEGIRRGLEAAHMIVGSLLKDDTPEDHANLIMRAEAKIIYASENPDTIAREAVLDQLTREAQADNMGYSND